MRTEWAYALAAARYRPTHSPSASSGHSWRGRRPAHGPTARSPGASTSSTSSSRNGPELPRRPRSSPRHPGPHGPGPHRHPVQPAAGDRQLAAGPHPARPAGQHLRRLQRRPRAARGAAPGHRGHLRPVQRAAGRRRLLDARAPLHGRAAQGRDRGLRGYGRLPPRRRPTAPAAPSGRSGPTPPARWGPSRSPRRPAARSPTPSPRADPVAGSAHFTGDLTALGAVNRAFYGLAVGTARPTPSSSRTTSTRSTSWTGHGERRRVELPAVAVDVPAGPDAVPHGLPGQRHLRGCWGRTPGAIVFDNTVVHLPVIGPGRTQGWRPCVSGSDQLVAALVAAAVMVDLWPDTGPRRPGRPRHADRRGGGTAAADLRRPGGRDRRRGTALMRAARPSHRQPARVADGPGRAVPALGPDRPPRAGAGSIVVTIDPPGRGTRSTTPPAAATCPTATPSRAARPRGTTRSPASTAASSTSTTPAPRSGSARTGSAASCTPRSTWNNAFWIDRDGSTGISKAGDGRPDPGVPADRDHQRQLPPGPRGVDRASGARVGIHLGLPHHRRPARRGADGGRAGRPGRANTTTSTPAADQRQVLVGRGRAPSSSSSCVWARPRRCAPGCRGTPPSPSAASGSCSRGAGPGDRRPDPAPRTAVGIDRDTGRILLLAIDGRQSHSRGHTLVEPRG